MYLLVLASLDWFDLYIYPAPAANSFNIFYIILKLINNDLERERERFCMLIYTYSAEAKSLSISSIYT